MDDTTQKLVKRYFQNERKFKEVFDRLSTLRSELLDKLDVIRVERNEAHREYVVELHTIRDALLAKYKGQERCINCRHKRFDNQMLVYSCRLEDSAVAFDCCNEDEMLRFVEHSCENWIVKE